MGRAQDAFVVHRCASDAEWALVRRQGIGGSEAAAVWGADVSPYTSPLAIYAAKVALEDDAPFDAEWLEVGRELEAPIARLYERRTGRKLRDLGRRTVLRSARWPWMQATLDRVVTDPARARGDRGCLECKNRGVFALDDFEDGVPLHVQLQVQHQLAVTGYRWGSVAALVGGNRFHWLDVARDDELIALHVERCRVLWQEHVERRAPPAADGSEATRDALQRLYREREGVEVQLSAAAAVWALEYHAATKDLKDAEKRRDEAANQLRAHIGEASVGRLPDGSGFSYRTVHETVVAAHTRPAYRRLAPLKARAT